MTIAWLYPTSLFVFFVVSATAQFLAVIEPRLQALESRLEGMFESRLEGNESRLEGKFEALREQIDGELPPGFAWF